MTFFLFVCLLTLGLGFGFGLFSTFVFKLFWMGFCDGLTEKLKAFFWDGYINIVYIKIFSYYNYLNEGYTTSMDNHYLFTF